VSASTQELEALTGRPPPTDGRRAWSVAIAAAIAAAVGLGTVTSHGVLVAELAPTTLYGVAAGAVLISTSAALQFGLGPVVGALTERHGIARVVALGASAYGVGAGYAAISDDLRRSVMAYAIGTGIAGACTLAPLLATVAGWHQRRRAAAVAIVSAGNAIGTLALAPWLAASVVRVGLSRTWMLVAVFGTTLLVLTALALRSPPRTGSVDPPSVGRALTDGPLRRFYLAGVLGSAGVIATLGYLAPYALEMGLRGEHGAALLGLTSAVGIASRLAVSAIPTSAAFRAYRATQLVMAVSALAWLAAPLHAGMLVAFALLFGLASGAWSALAPLVVAQAHPDGLASLLGLLYTSPAFGGALGPLVLAAWLALVPAAHAAWFLAACFVSAAMVLRPLSPTGVPSDGPSGDGTPAACRGGDR
jgi:MFS family permease